MIVKLYNELTDSEKSEIDNMPTHNPFDFNAVINSQGGNYLVVNREITINQIQFIFDICKNNKPFNIIINKTVPNPTQIKRRIQRILNNKAFW